VAEGLGQPILLFAGSRKLGDPCFLQPPAKIETLRRVLRDEAVAPTEQDALTLLRSLPHGHVAAALGTLRKIGLDRVLSQGGVQPRREVALSIAMIVARLIDPASKLATARGLADDTANLARCSGSGALTSKSFTRRSTG